jgi:hypothetical protein
VAVPRGIYRLHCLHWSQVFKSFFAYNWYTITKLTGHLCRDHTGMYYQCKNYLCYVYQLRLNINKFSPEQPISSEVYESGIQENAKNEYKRKINKKRMQSIEWCQQLTIKLCNLMHSFFFYVGISKMIKCATHLGTLSIPLSLSPSVCTIYMNTIYVYEC